MTSSDGPDGVRTFRSTSGLIALGAVALVGIFLLGEAAVRAGWTQLLLFTPWVLLGIWVIYVLSVASMVRVDASGAVVQNFLRRTSFGWDQVRDIDMRWQLVFTLVDDAHLTCYGGPARARPGRGTRGGEASAPAGFRELADMAELKQQASGQADAPIRRSWDKPALIAIAAIAVWALIAVLVTQSS